MAEWAEVGDALGELYAFEVMPDTDELLEDDKVMQFNTVDGYRCPIPFNLESWLFLLPTPDFKTYGLQPIEFWHRTRRVRCTTVPKTGIFTILKPRGGLDLEVTTMIETSCHLIVGLKSGQIYSFSLKSLTKQNFYVPMEAPIKSLALYYRDKTNARVDRYTLLLVIAGNTFRAYRYTTGGIYNSHVFDEPLVGIFGLNRTTVATISGDFFNISFDDNNDSLYVEKIQALDMPIHQVKRIYSDQKSILNEQILPILVRFSSYLAVIDASPNIGPMHVLKKFRVPHLFHGLEYSRSKMAIGDYRLFFAQLTEFDSEGEPNFVCETTVHIAEMISIDGESYTKIVVMFGLIDIEVAGDLLLLSTSTKRVLVFNCHSLRLLYTLLMPEYITSQNVVNNTYIGGTRSGKLISLPLGLEMICQKCKEEAVLPESPSNYVCIHAGQEKND